MLSLASLLAGSFCVLLPAGAAAAGLTGGFGGFATAGSADRDGVGLYADAQADRGLWRPLGWIVLRGGEDTRDFSFGGGAWRDLGGALWGKLGAGLTYARDVDEDQSLHGAALSGVLERRAPEWTAGGDYSFSTGEAADTGRIGAARALSSARGHGRGHLREEPVGRRASFTYHELGGFFDLPLARSLLSARGALGVPSGGGLVTSQAASIRVPLVAPLSVLAGLTFEQFKGDNDVIVTVGIDYRFN